MREGGCSNELLTCTSKTEAPVTGMRILTSAPSRDVQDLLRRHGEGRGVNTVVVGSSSITHRRDSFNPDGAGTRASKKINAS